MTQFTGRIRVILEGKLPKGRRSRLIVSFRRVEYAGKATDMLSNLIDLNLDLPRGGFASPSHSPEPRGIVGPHSSIGDVVLLSSCSKIALSIVQAITVAVINQIGGDDLSMHIDAAASLPRLSSDSIEHATASDGMPFEAKQTISIICVDDCDFPLGQGNLNNIGQALASI